MEWYYIVGIILSSLGMVAYIVNKLEKVMNDNNNIKKDVTDLKTRFELSEKQKNENINEIKADIKLINQKFDIYIKQIVELSTKHDDRITQLEKHTQGCLFANKSLKDIKEIIR